MMEKVLSFVVDYVSETEQTQICIMLAIKIFETYTTNPIYWDVIQIKIIFYSEVNIIKVCNIKPSCSSYDHMIIAFNVRVGS